MKHTLTIDYTDEVLAGTGLSPNEFVDQAKLLLAGKLYELGKLTSGQAARLCGKERVEFLFSLPQVGIAVSNLRQEDADAEIVFGTRN